MQKVYALAELILNNPSIERDARILGILRERVRNLILRPKQKVRGAKLPSLYDRFRGNGFPLKKDKNLRLKIPKWRSLSPWMKVQLASMVLAETSYLQFKLTIHDDLRAEWESAGRNLKVELRNSISRHLTRRFGKDAPRFFFVMEDRTKTGKLTRPHAHGSIELRRAPLPARGTGSRRLKRIAQERGRDEGELEAGKLLVIEALKAAGGRDPRFARTTCADQCRNLWYREPYHPIFNHQWVDYAFKNEKEFSPALSDNRLAMPWPLRAEAKRLWILVTQGEAAMDQWDA